MVFSKISIDEVKPPELNLIFEFYRRTEPQKCIQTLKKAYIFDNKSFFEASLRYFCLIHNCYKKFDLIKNFFNKIIKKIENELSVKDEIYYVINDNINEIASFSVKNDIKIIEFHCVYDRFIFNNDPLYKDISTTKDFWNFIFSHELQHYIQWAKGRINVDKDQNFIWENKKIKPVSKYNEYLEYPWEKEANNVGFSVMSSMKTMIDDEEKNINHLFFNIRQRYEITKSKHFN